LNDRQRVLLNNRITEHSALLPTPNIRCRPNSWSLPNIRHIFYRILDIFAENRILKVLDKKNRFLLVCILKMWGQTKIKDFWEILGLVSQKIVYKLFTQTDQNLNKKKFFTDYRQVFGCLYRIFGCRIFGRPLFGRIFGRQDCRSFTSGRAIDCRSIGPWFNSECLLNNFFSICKMQACDGSDRGSARSGISRYFADRIWIAFRFQIYPK
jgi:hypothetical protein